MSLPDRHRTQDAKEQLQKAIELCNAKVSAAKQSHPNFSDASAFIYASGIYNLQWTARQSHTCYYHAIDIDSNGDGHWHFLERMTQTPE